MNDRYLFRAKRKDNGEWVEGYLLNIAKINAFICTGKIKLDGAIKGHVAPEMYKVDPSTICQCTGIKDKNGKLIWENDIVKRTDIHEVGEPSVGIIEFDVEGAEFLIHWIDNEVYSPMYSWKDRIEVIGNIFDNPELMEWEE